MDTSRKIAGLGTGLALAALAIWFIVVQPAPPLPGGPGGAKH